MTIPTHPPTPDEERQLLTRLSGGDETDANRAIGEIVTRYQAMVEKTAWRIVRNRDAVEDVTQGVWVTCWKRCQALAVRGRLREYLVSVARTRALNWRRDEHRKQQLARAVAAWHVADDRTAVENDAVHLLTADDQAHIVRAVIAAMPPRRRAVYDLVVEDGYTHDEVAKLLTMSPRTVSNHMWHANQTLRRALALGDSPALGGHLPADPERSSLHALWTVEEQHNA